MGPVETLCVRVVCRSVCVCACEAVVADVSLLRHQIGKRSIVMSVSVCLCVCVCLFVHDHIFGTTHPIFIIIFVPVTHGRGSVLRCRRSDTLCTSGFTDDVIFAHKPRLLDVAAQQCTRSLGLGCIMCAVIPGAGQRAHRTSFRALPLYA